MAVTTEARTGSDGLDGRLSDGLARQLSKVIAPRNVEVSGVIRAQSASIKVIVPWDGSARAVCPVLRLGSEPIRKMTSRCRIIEAPMTVPATPQVVRQRREQHRVAARPHGVAGGRGCAS